MNWPRAATETAQLEPHGQLMNRCGDGIKEGSYPLRDVCCHCKRETGQESDLGSGCEVTPESLSCMRSLS